MRDDHWMAAVTEEAVSMARHKAASLCDGVKTYCESCRGRARPKGRKECQEDHLRAGDIHHALEGLLLNDEPKVLEVAFLGAAALRLEAIHLWGACHKALRPSRRNLAKLPTERIGAMGGAMWPVPRQPGSGPGKLLRIVGGSISFGYSGGSEVGKSTILKSTWQNVAVLMI